MTRSDEHSDHNEGRDMLRVKSTQKSKSEEKERSKKQTVNSKDEKETAKKKKESEIMWLRTQRGS